jgi:N-methylhydantoinase A
MRISIDVGGTFTDLVADFGTGALQMFKAPTTYPDPLNGIFDVIGRAASSKSLSVDELLGKTELLFHSTTRPINAVLTGTAAKTGLLVTEGHPDILVFREGGRVDPFNYEVPFPDPFIPRSLTYEVSGRIWADGSEISSLDFDNLLKTIEKLKADKVEAVAVCLLWSIVNPDHELQVAALLEKHLPGIPYTLSHKLNPTIREYRRCSATAIDACLKPVMSGYLRALQTEMSARGFIGQIYAVTSQGGLVDLEQLANRPILALNSGPSMAPVSGKLYSELEKADLAIITDAGGTTYDVSLVRKGVIPWTSETWIGPPYQGHLTGFPSVDVKSVGSGGGTIVSVEGGRLLKIGPESAGSDPGPVCYSRGGLRPTVTDAAVVLGYIDAAYFLGGDMVLDVNAAREVIHQHVAIPLNLSVENAALAVMDLSAEQMVNAIEDITVKQGIDPQHAVLVAGGGASGLSAVQIARRLRCKKIIVPEVGAALSAAGAMMSEMKLDFVKTELMHTDEFDSSRAEEAIAELTGQANDFFNCFGDKLIEKTINYSFEGRYPSQVWEIDVPLNNCTSFKTKDSVKELVTNFHSRHKELFSFRDDGDSVQIMSFRAVARCRLAESDRPQHTEPNSASASTTMKRAMFFHDTGFIDSPAYRLEDLDKNTAVSGPAVIESSFTTIVLPPMASAQKNPDGYVVITLD